MKRGGISAPFFVPRLIPLRSGIVKFDFEKMKLGLGNTHILGIFGSGGQGTFREVAKGKSLKRRCLARYIVVHSAGLLSRNEYSAVGDFRKRRVKVRLFAGYGFAFFHRARR